MRKLLLPLLLCFWFIPKVNAQNIGVEYEELWEVVGISKNDSATFIVTKFDNETCSIIFNIDDVEYKSFECSENYAKLKYKNDTITIEYFMPELVQLDIDILGTNHRFDYTSELELEQKPNNRNKLGNQTGIAISSEITNTFSIVVSNNENKCDNEFGIVCLNITSDKVKYSNNSSTTNNFCLIKQAISLVENKELDENIKKVFIKFE